MPIDDRLDRENVAHIHHRISCSHKKRWDCVLCREMDEPGSHHSQHTDTERKTNHCMFSLIGGWTMQTHGHREGGITHWGLLGGTRGGTVGGGEFGSDNTGRNARYRWWGWRQQTTLPCMYLCNNPACSSHVPQNLKCNKIHIYIYIKLAPSQWLTPAIPTLWEAKVGRSQGQEFKTSQANMVKLCLY